MSDSSMPLCPVCDTRHETGMACTITENLKLVMAESTPHQVIGRCEPCDKTLSGSSFEHLGEAHPGEMYSCWTDPESGTWIIFERAPEFEARDSAGATDESERDV